jgi:hypothetical protein
MDIQSIGGVTLWFKHLRVVACSFLGRSQAA